MSKPSSPKGPLSPEVARLARKLEEDPRSKVFIPLAEEYVKAGYYEEAVAVLEEGVNTYPNFVTALVALARVYVRLHEADKARKVLKDVTRQSPENLLAHRMLAKLYLEAGQLRDASRSCEIVLSANPKDVETLTLKTTIAQKDAALASGEDAEASDANPAGPMFRFSSGEARPPETERQPAARAAQRPDPSDKVARLQRLLDTIRQRREPVDDPA